MSRVEKENANFMVAFGADSTTGSYLFARGHGNPAPNVDADTIAVFLAKLGFPSCGKEVRAALD